MPSDEGEEESAVGIPVIPPDNLPTLAPGENKEAKLIELELLRYKHMLERLKLTGEGSPEFIQSIRGEMKALEKRYKDITDPYNFNEKDKDIEDINLPTLAPGENKEAKLIQ